VEKIRIERSKIEKIITDYVKGTQGPGYVRPLMEISELTARIWEYIEETVGKAKYPITVRIDDTGQDY